MTTPTPITLVIGSFRSEFARYRHLAEGAAGQVSWEGLRGTADPAINSIAVVMKHIAGNLRSRWTDPFTTDGEKPWRDRDREFIDEFADRASLDAWWKAGWEAIEGVLVGVSDSDLPRTLLIRGEPHTLALALARSLAHTSYHCGQVVLLSRHAAAMDGAPWQTLTIPRGGSAAFNAGIRGVQ